MINKNLLRAKISLKGDNWKVMCGKIGMYSATLYSKLRGDTEFKPSEISKIMQIYQLSPEDVVSIFLTGEQ